jgi:hypothetical protein
LNELKEGNKPTKKVKNKNRSIFYYFFDQIIGVLKINICSLKFVGRRSIEGCRQL